MENLRNIERLLPIAFQGQEDKFVEQFAKTTGILSLTEDAENTRMWCEHAADGCGFVLKYDATHPFFFHRGDDRKVRRLLRKVVYRDDRIDDFWKNPYYLFLVKDRKWDFEKEWRVLKNLDECKVKMIGDGKVAYYLDMPPRLIQSIIFGPKCCPEYVAEMGALIRGFDATIDLDVAR